MSNIRIKLNWDEIFDGQERLLIKGKDYTGKTEAFSKYLYQKAREHGIKIKQKILQDKSGIAVQKVIEKQSTALVVSSSGQLSESRDNEITSYVEEHEWDKYPSIRDKIAGWFNEIFFGGEQEVDVPVLDEYGRQIPIMKEFPGGFKGPTGKVQTERKKVTFSPRLYKILKFPTDYNENISNKKLISILAKAMEYTGKIDMSQVHFDASKKNKIIIRYGSLAKSYIDAEDYPETKNLYVAFGKIKCLPVSRDQAEDWMKLLLRDGQIVLWKKKDYSGSADLLCTLLHNNFPDIEFYAKEETDRETGWTTLLLTVRKPMLARFQAKDDESGIETMQRWLESEEGKRIEQEHDKKKLEHEEQAQLKNIGYAKLKYIENMQLLEKREVHINKNAPDSIKEELLDEVKSEREQLREDMLTLIEEDELNKIEQERKLIK